MKQNKQKNSFLLTAALLVTVLLLTTFLSGCGAGQTPEDTPPKERPLVKVATLKGPTGMGMAKLMEDDAAGTTTNDYVFELSGAPDEIVGKLTSGTVDVAALPSNLAAALYNKTGGKIQIAAINTLGVLYVLEQGDTVHQLMDLAGKTLAATGQGATPEYVLNYILEQNGLMPGKDVTTRYLTEHAELAALAVAGKEPLVMLPEPFVTTVLVKNPSYRIALDLNQEWTSANKMAGAEGDLVMGCLVVRTEFAQQNKDALDAFLQEYQASAAFVSDNTAEAAAMIAQQGILADADLAEKAIANCSIVYLDGEQMKQNVGVYYDILFAADPKSVGGTLPDEAFYYSK